MHDAFLKSVFADRRMVEILIRSHVPEWAEEIDSATLREEPTQLVAKKTLQMRHPDLIWSADTVHGGRVMLLIEFHSTVERLWSSGRPPARRWARGCRRGRVHGRESGHDVLIECTTGDDFIERVRIG